MQANFYFENKRKIIISFFRFRKWHRGWSMGEI
jgi:hypothetical protein